MAKCFRPFPCRKRLKNESRMGMIYRKLGRTGRDVSAIGFGGMRFRDAANRDECGATLERALALGVNYFDTAPAYFGGKSEERFGEGLHGKDVLISTKSMAADGSELRRDLERSLRRLRRDRVDIFHIWYVVSKEDYERRRQGGAIAAVLRARDEGLVGAVFLSTHMEGRDICDVLGEKIFAGVTLGFSAINAPFRQAAIKAAKRQGIAALCMNPLSGGLIPRNETFFSFLRGPRDRSVVEGALRYVLSAPGVTAALVGCADARQVEQAAAAVDPFVPWTGKRMAAMYNHLSRDMNRICTGCGYCTDCPAKLPIPKLMQAYNRKLLGGSAADIRISMTNEWAIPLSDAARCTACGLCETKCTQKLPIVERLKHIARL